MKRRLIAVAAVSIPALCLLAAVVVAMAFSLQADIGVLAKHARHTLRAEQDLRAEAQVVGDKLALLSQAQAEQALPPADAVQPAAVAAADPPARSPALRPIDVGGRRAAPTVMKARAAATPECIFRSGDSAGLMDCLRQQQDRIGPIPSRSM